MAPTLFFRTALAGAMVLCAVAPTGLACGSSDCKETLTCPGLGNDATADAQDASVASGDASSGSEAAPGEDASLEGGNTGTGDSTLTPTADATVDTMNTTAEGSADGVSDAGADGPTIPTEDATDGALAPCTCAPAVPAGWTGPAVTIEEIVDSGAPGQPTCPPSYPMFAFPIFSGPSDAAAACACACEGRCTLQISAYAGATCDAGPACATPTVSNGCVPIDGCAARTAEISSPPAFTGCEVAATKNAPPEWGTVGSVCGSGGSFPQGACEAGQICATTPPPTTGPGLCIYKPGLTTCPPGYPTLHTHYANATDTRGCDASGCGCSGPDSGTCETPVVTLSSAADCTDTATLVSLTNACSAPFPATPSLYVGATLPTSARACLASGDASPVGAVVPGETFLLCCTD